MKTIKNIVLLSVSSMLLFIGTTVLGYTIQKGDTLWGLANVFNTTVNKIVNDNNIKNPDKIYIGQEIAINNNVNGQPSYSIEQLFPSDSQKFGSINFVAGNKFYLSGSGIGTTDTSITVDSFTTPDGIELAMTDFGSIGYATIEPGSSKKEFISFTGVSQAAANSKATLTGVSRGLRFVSPYTASSSLALSHSGGSVLIISNPPQLYNELTAKSNAETITGVWTFSSSSMPKLDAYLAPTDDTEFATKKYADDLAIAGAPDATESVKGLVEIGTKAEIISATTTGGTGAIIVPTIGMVSATTSATTSIVATLPSGKISQGFIDQTEAYTWSGTHSNTATTTLATTTVSNLQATTFGVSGDAVITGNATTTGNSMTTGNITTNGAYYGNGANLIGVGNCVAGFFSTTSAVSGGYTVGTTTITHNLGFTPSYITIDGLSTTYAQSKGFATSTLGQYYFGSQTSGGNEIGVGIGKILLFNQLGSADNYGILTELTSTTFSILWYQNVADTRYMRYQICK